jgi:hypothetical protein
MRSLLFVLAAACALPAAAQDLTLFRMSDVDLRDPHVFVSIGVCVDATTQFNDELQQSVQLDEDADGELDASYILQFLPLDQSQPTNFAAAGSARCAPPFTAATCGPIEAPFFAEDVPISNAGTCLAELPGTTRPYAPAVTPSTAQCWVSMPATVSVTLAGIPVTLRQVQVASTFAGDPATSLTNGLLRGFITETDANNTLIPAAFPFIGGRPLSSVLPGGSGACAGHSDKDMLGDGTLGWWFYLNYTAVPATDPFFDGFADGFENPPPP